MRLVHCSNGFALCLNLFEMAGKAQPEQKTHSGEKTAIVKEMA